MTKVNKISVAFTDEEIDWLCWVMRDVLSKELAQHPAAQKILKTQQLFKEVNDAIEEAGKKIEQEDEKTVRKSAASSDN